jgi:hypothetical protein
LVLGLWPGMLMDLSGKTMLTTMSAFISNVIH